MGTEKWDVVVVGGGPAGLTAAIYLARYHRKVLVVDGGNSRAAMIPLSRNHPGYPEGVRGTDLLDDMRAQAKKYGAVLEMNWVEQLSGKEDDFTLLLEDETQYSARAVVLATGVVNLRPDIDEETHARALESGVLRYCPICDAYEVTGQRIAVIGSSDHGVAEALFLRQYSDQISLLALYSCDLDAQDRANLKEAGVTWETSPIAKLDFLKTKAKVTLEDGRTIDFDTVYPALGSETRNMLGKMVGTDLCDDVCFVTDAHQRTSVPGIYAAGDACDALDQISVAMGHGAVAATALHNDMRDRDGHTPD